MKKFDVCVIGTGVAGTAIATRCADEGLRVAITDALPYGGTCALRGCDPKKILIDAAEVLDFARRMKGKGIDQEPRVAWPDLMAFKQEFTTPVPREKEKMFNEKGITTLHSRAKFVDENRLMIGNETIEAEKFVVATGAQPRDLGIPGKEHAYTSSDFLELKELPESMLFIGGGYVAFEFAHLAAHCSTKITIVQRGEAPLKNFDQDIVAHLVEKTREIGIELVLNTEVTAIKKNSRGFLVTGDKNGHTKEFQADMVINSAGRVPEIRDLDLSKANVSHSEKGVEVNDFLQSVSNPRVYAAGDAAGTSLALTPVASMEADIVTDNILKGNHRMADYLETPTVVFTVPPMASVGLSEKLAKQKNLDFSVHQGSAADWYNAKRLNQKTYAYKVLISEDYDKIIGAHLIGPHAEESINLFAMAMKAGMKASAVKNMLYAYPSLGYDIQYML